MRRKKASHALQQEQLSVMREPDFFQVVGVPFSLMSMQWEDYHEVQFEVPGTA